MSHTPGPWEVRSGSSLCIHQADDGAMLARMVYKPFATAGNFSPGQMRDNASLIAAAPEMLEALKWYVHYHGNTNAPIETFEGYLAVAERAIAKAEGKA